jgi:hypothetical protein
MAYRPVEKDNVFPSLNPSALDLPTILNQSKEDTSQVNNNVCMKVSSLEGWSQNKSLVSHYSYLAVKRDPVILVQYEDPGVMYIKTEKGFGTLCTQ